MIKPNRMSMKEFHQLEVVAITSPQHDYERYYSRSIRPNKDGVYTWALNVWCEDMQSIVLVFRKPLTDYDMMDMIMIYECQQQDDETHMLLLDI